MNDDWVAVVQKAQRLAHCGEKKEGSGRVSCNEGADDRREKNGKRYNTDTVCRIFFSGCRGRLVALDSKR